MTVKMGSISCVSTSLSSSFQPRKTYQVNLPPRSRDFRQLKIRDSELESDDNTDQEDDIDDDILNEDDAQSNKEIVEVSRGRPGFISFYNQCYVKEPEIIVSTIATTNQANLLWFVGPGVLVASFIFPSLYMRKILSSVFEDSLLTDFLILFFTEALFYCGVAMFLFIVDRLRGPINSKKRLIPSPQLVYRITSVAALVLSLVIPMVTMGLVWPWTGPAASATLAPYLVGIVVQFAFEQYARYIKSPSWPLIPVIFQGSRRKQLIIHQNSRSIWKQKNCKSKAAMALTRTVQLFKKPSMKKLIGAAQKVQSEGEVLCCEKNQGTRDVKEIYERSTQSEMDEVELMLLDEEPRSYSEAKEGKDWQDAMKAEIASIKRNKTWILIDLPKGVKPIGLKWVYKTKRYAQGKITKTRPKLWLKEHKVYKLVKALYGLKQAPRAWNTKLDSVLQNLGFTKCKHEPAVYKRSRKGRTILMGVYVDDLLIKGECKEEIIRVKQRNNEPSLKLSKKDEMAKVDPTLFRKWVGYLRYLTHTRPDLSYSVGYVSRFMQDPSQAHMQAIKQILRYVKGTSNLGLTYLRNGSERLCGYSDSGHSIDRDDGRSTTGILFLYNGTPVAWNS
ncbi:hypothetical protein E3N88_10191 [Mikania micrantha]|uniref:Reverse transcriptase Ty1/copia-type domain-containing protein n=1 Tax=Mikania micrantha TaxID=192012 RepID=A0A5N6P9Y8_9ASTR|nr:hypothetical protein E3N88_10191 [Mikania micrantha]